MLSSGPLFYANDAQNTAVTATRKLLVSGVVEAVLFDTGAGRSCMATDTAARILQRGRARVVGSLRAQLNTGGGAVVDDFQRIRANLALPSCFLVSVEEDFLVVPTRTAGLIILGMTFLQFNCILDLPNFSITFQCRTVGAQASHLFGW
jgi:hypothetical protein